MIDDLVKGSIYRLLTCKHKHSETEAKEMIEKDLEEAWGTFLAPHLTPCGLLAEKTIQLYQERTRNG